MRGLGDLSCGQTLLQEAAVIDDSRQLRLARSLVPADEPVTRPQPPRRRGELNTPGERVLRLADPDEIPQVRPIGHLVAQVVITLDELTPQRALRGVRDEPQRYRSHVRQPALAPRPLHACFREDDARPTPRPLFPPRRQLQQPPPLEQIQVLVALPRLELSVRPNPREGLANRPRQLVSRDTARSDDLDDQLPLVVADRLAAEAGPRHVRGVERSSRWEEAARGPEPLTTPDRATSALARLLGEVWTTWTAVTGSRSEAEFATWLEETATLLTNGFLL